MIGRIVLFALLWWWLGDPAAVALGVWFVLYRL